MKRAWPRGAIMPAGAHVLVLTTGGGRLKGMLLEPRFASDDVVLRLNGSEQIIELGRHAVRGVLRVPALF